MISSVASHDGQVLLHRGKGSLSVRDIAEMTFVTSQAAPLVIIWDLTDTVFELDDVTYEASIRSSQQFVDASAPRLFVTNNPLHYFRIFNVMRAVKPVYPWRQFETLDLAIAYAIEKCGVQIRAA